MLGTCEQPRPFASLGISEAPMHSSAQSSHTQGCGLTELEPLRETVFSMVESQPGLGAATLQQLDLSLAPHSLMLPPSNYNPSQNPAQASGISSYFSLATSAQQFLSVDQPSSSGMYISAQGCHPARSIASTQPPVLLHQPTPGYNFIQEHSSLAMLPPTSAVIPLEGGMVSDGQYGASLLLQLQQLQLDQQQQELQQLLAERELELEQLRMLVQQQQGKHQQDALVVNPGDVTADGGAAPSQEPCSFAGTYAVPAGSSTAATAAPSQLMYLLQHPGQSSSQRRHSMLQLPLNSLHAVSEEMSGAVDVHDANRGPAQRRYSMVQLQPHPALPAEPGGGGAAAGHAARTHRGPSRAASWGGDAFREAGLGTTDFSSPTQTSLHTAAESMLDTYCHHPSQMAGPAGAAALGSVPRSGPMLNQGYPRVRRNSAFQAPGPNSLLMVAEEADRPADEPCHQRRGPNRAASWAAQTFARGLNPCRRSVDLQRPRDVSAGTTARYEQPPGGAMGAAAGLAQGSSSFTDPAPNRARRNSVEAPKWAGAFWNPMAEVVKSGQLANGGTGVFIPKSMQLALAGGAGKDAKTAGPQAASPKAA